MDSRDFLNLFWTLIELASFFKQSLKDIILSKDEEKMGRGKQKGKRKKRDNIPQNSPNTYCKIGFKIYQTGAITKKGNILNNLIFHMILLKPKDF